MFWTKSSLFCRLIIIRNELASPGFESVWLCFPIYKSLKSSRRNRLVISTQTDTFEFITLKITSGIMLFMKNTVISLKISRNVHPFGLSLFHYCSNKTYIFQSLITAYTSLYGFLETLISSTVYCKIVLIFFFFSTFYYSYILFQTLAE